MFRNLFLRFSVTAINSNAFMRSFNSFRFQSIFRSRLYLQRHSSQSILLSSVVLGTVRIDPYSQRYKIFKQKKTLVAFFSFSRP